MKRFLAYEKHYVISNSLKGQYSTPTGKHVVLYIHCIMKDLNDAHLFLKKLKANFYMVKIMTDKHT